MLSFDRIVAPGATPDRWALLCHGILGSRRNWRSFAKKLVDQHPDHGVINVDLRNHGDSPVLPGPHDLAACARDLGDLARHLSIEPDVVIGHSFGGKVVLKYAADPPAALEQVWVLDARPDPATASEVAESDVSQVIAALAELPLGFERRKDIVPELTGRGFSRTLALWMTTNLRRAPSGQWTWRFRLDGVQEMIADYYQADLRHVLQTPLPDLTVHVVRAARSDRWPTAVLDWFDGLPAGAPGRLHLLEEAGHWVHVDNPGGLLDIMDDEL